MTKAAIFPTKYVQGNGELKRIKSYVEHLGNSFFVLISESGYKRFGSILKESFGDSVKVDFAIFNGECSKTEINRLREEFKAKGSDVIIAVGGGKIHDTCKAIGYYEKAPVVIVPTIASTDAPCSAVSVIYTDDGVVEEYLFVPKNPDLVLVDTEIVANAPARLLVAGMGDALATYFEARASVRSHSKTMAGGYTTDTAFALAKLCYDTLINEGYKAKLAVENKVVTQAVEKIIEANTLLSGIGFESGGLGAAHSVHNGFTALEETHSLYHGEKVAFGVLVQLVLENAPMEEIEEVLYFCNEVGLPTTLRELNVTDKSKEKLMKVAELSCAETETIHCMPFEVTPEDVYAAILTADALGENYKK
ncbi:glycerol dehydrogenase [Lutispora thermophila]|uniref:Glycerol dehydrogenase n=1 Tax=Lutispora thermophila DSM 19022 TaxID=1122184 RepID=A0A1M6CZE5_9FIRM|nr:glycerol dehydrogenase [Lutispora thermophila]SHI66184.1 glycerol 2-dehydrogenase (NAD+) [Lutispora thermophila DSM 19022]